MVSVLAWCVLSACPVCVVWCVCGVSEAVGESDKSKSDPVRHNSPLGTTKYRLAKCSCRATAEDACGGGGERVLATTLAPYPRKANRLWSPQKLKCRRARRGLPSHPQKRDHLVTDRLLINARGSIRHAGQ